MNISGQEEANSAGVTCGQSPPTSVNSLQIALISLKERCYKQQKRIEELEQEKVTMNNSRAELYAEIKKLHEANVKLREKNLSLNQELHQRNKENCDIRQVLEGDRARNANNVRQLERLQHEVLNRVARPRTPVVAEFEDNIISSIEPDEGKNTGAETDEEVKTLLDKSSETMSTFRTSLISQQAALMSCLAALQQNKVVKDQQANLLLGAVTQLAASVQCQDRGEGEKIDGRCCPMCEAVFSGLVSQDQFEAHVLEHFVYEESDTLSNFDTVPDAFWAQGGGSGMTKEPLNQLADG